MASSYLNFLRESNKTFILLFVLRLFSASEAEFCNSKLVKLGPINLRTGYQVRRKIISNDIKRTCGVI